MYNRETNGKGGNASNEPRACSPKPRKLTPQWLKPRDSTGVAGPPKLPKGSDCEWQFKHENRWSNSRELSLQEVLERNTISYLAPKTPSPRTTEPYKPLSRQGRRMAPPKTSSCVTTPSGTVAKTSSCVTAPSRTVESRSTPVVEYDDMFATVGISKCYVDQNTDRVFFRIDDLYRGSTVKPTGALIPIMEKLIARTETNAEPKPVCGVPIEASRTRAKSLCNQSKSQRTPRNQTVGPKLRMRVYQATVSSEVKVVEEAHKLKRPKAYVVTQGCAIKDQIEEKKRLFSELTSLDPFDNIEIVVPRTPKPRPVRAVKNKEKQDRVSTHQLQDESDQKGTEPTDTIKQVTSSDKKMPWINDKLEIGPVESPEISFMERGCEPTPGMFVMERCNERSRARACTNTTKCPEVSRENSPARSETETSIEHRAVSRDDSATGTCTNTINESPAVSRERSAAGTCTNTITESPAVSRERSPAGTCTDTSIVRRPVSRDDSPARTEISSVRPAKIHREIIRSEDSRGTTHVEVSGPDWSWRADFGVNNLVEQSAVTQLDGFHRMSEAGTRMSQEDEECQTDDFLLENGLMSVGNEEESKRNNIEQKEIEKKEMEKKEMEKREMEKREMEKKDLEKKSIDRRSPSIF